jgi:hypothetical protein
MGGQAPGCGSSSTASASQPSAPSKQRSVGGAGTLPPADSAPADEEGREGQGQSPEERVAESQLAYATARLEFELHAREVGTRALPALLRPPCHPALRCCPCA